MAEKNGSMESLQERVSDDYPGGKPAGGPGDSDGQKSGASSTKGRNYKLGNTSGITDKFHNRPSGMNGKEVSSVVNKGDGLSK
jgi:hypothetical protein